MAKKINVFILIIAGMFIWVSGCDMQRDNLIPGNIPIENGQTPDPQPPTMVDNQPDNAEVAFNNNLFPILTAKCAYVGCHDANGYDGLDFRTYQSFISGDDEGESVFIPGNANESDIIEEIVSGRMPPDGPK